MIGVHIKRRVRLITISGPRGSGKGTIVEALVNDIPGLRRVVPHTTRRPRAYEVDGSEYHFVSVPEFDALRVAGRFAWWAKIGPTQRAGTTYDELELHDQGSVLDILPTGARSLRRSIAAAGGCALLIAVIAPREERTRRIKHRQPDLTEATIQRMLDEDPAWPAAHQYHGFDLIIDNIGDVTEACARAVTTARVFLLQ